MPFNSSGVYTPVAGATTAAPGVVISSSVWNAINTDVAAALTLLGQQMYGSSSITITGSPYTPLNTDTLLLVDTSGGPITIDLPPSASRSGYPLQIIDATGHAATNNITVTPNGAETINGAASLVLNVAYESTDLIPVTAGWLDVTPVSPLAGTATPLMDGVAAAGVSSFYSRQDHIHPTDTSRAPIASPTFTGTVTLPGAPTTSLQAATKAYVDGRTNGVVPENAQSANYTTVLTDAGGLIHHPASDASARTFTIAANSSVAYTLGTVISFTNLSAGAVTIAIATDTMYLAGTGTTGSRTLAQYGMATAIKTDATTWVISGTGLT